MPRRKKIQDLRKVQKTIKEIKEARAPIDVRLTYSDIKGPAIELLAEAIKEAHFPLDLYLIQDDTGKTSVKLLKLLAEAIKEVRVPLTLNLNDDNIGEAGAGFFSEAIKEAQVPLTLNLGNNNIGEAGARCLAEAIKEAQVPLGLCLSYNLIGEAGVRCLAEAIKEVQVPLTLDLGFDEIGDVGAGFLAEAIKEAQVPINFDLSHNKIREAGARFLAEAIREVRVPLTLNLDNNNIGEAGAKILAEAIKEARVPLTLDVLSSVHLNKWYIGNNGQAYLKDAKKDNFIIDARSNPSTFLSRIKFSPSMRMLELASDFPSVLAKLVQDYIGDEDLAWLEVAAIRAVEGVSHENKYSSINYELLNAAYSTLPGADVAPGLALDEEQMLNDSQKARIVSSSTYSSLQSQFLNLLLLISRIKALSNKLEIPQGYVDVPGDGLCFYHAISRQLGNNRYSALELQQMAINEVINHLDRYEGFAAQYGGGLNGFLSYHLQRQDSEKGGWADNIIVQALANALERVIEVQLFDRVGNAIGVGPVVINPHNIADPNVLRLGNLDYLHFVAASSTAANYGGEVVGCDVEEELPSMARPLKRKQAFVEYNEAHKAARLEAVENIQEDEVAASEKDERYNCEEEIYWDQYRCKVQDDDSAPTHVLIPAPTAFATSSPTPNTTQVYYETLEFGDVSSFTDAGVQRQDLNPAALLEIDFNSDFVSSLPQNYELNSPVL